MTGVQTCALPILDLNRVIGYGLRITGTINDHFSSHTITANTRNGSAITYYKNVENTPILSSSSQIILVNSNQTTGSFLNIDGASIAIQLYNSHNNKFLAVTITNSRYNGINGILSSGNEFVSLYISDTLLGANLHFEQSNSLLFSFVTSSDSIIGLLAINCNSLKIQFSNILSNINGIDIYTSSTIEVSYTTIDDNFIGISLTDCYYPTIQASNLQNFGVIGILLDNCVLPYLFDNEFTESSGTPLYLSNTDSGTISLQSFSSLTTPGAKIIMDAESSNNYLDRITMSNINTGIEVWGNNNILQTSVISGASTAIEIYGSNNELNSLSITSSTTGILVQANSFNTKILGSTFSDLTTAIHIQSDADLVYIEYNQIEQSDVGIRVDVASNVEIRYTLYCTNIANTQISPLATNIVQFQNWNCFSGSDAAEDSLKDTTDPRNNEPGIKALDEIPGYSTSLLIILGLISIFGLIIKRRS